MDERASPRGHLHLQGARGRTLKRRLAQQPLALRWRFLSCGTAARVFDDRALVLPPPCGLVRSAFPLPPNRMATVSGVFPSATSAGTQSNTCASQTRRVFATARPALSVGCAALRSGGLRGRQTALFPGTAVLALKLRSPRAAGYRQGARGEHQEVRKATVHPRGQRGKRPRRRPRRGR